MAKADYVCCEVCNCKTVYNPESDAQVVCFECYQSLKSEQAKRERDAALAMWKALDRDNNKEGFGWVLPTEDEAMKLWEERKNEKL